MKISMILGILLIIEFCHAQSNVGRSSYDFNVVKRRYLTYQEGRNYLENANREIQKMSQTFASKVGIAGYTYENRQINSFTLQHRQKRQNPIILIDAGIHAREWHSRSMGFYVIKKLIDEAKLYNRGLIYNASFVVVPSLNPDGYTYSRNYDKFWRKNRRPMSNGCYGVDGNRNYDVYWYSSGVDETKPCSEVYRGPRPFSEAESSAMRDIMNKVRGRCILYITIHTFGNSVLYPWGYSTNPHPRARFLHAIAQQGAFASANRFGTRFTVAQSGKELYIATGGSDDYAITQGGIPYAFTLELGKEELGFSVPLRDLPKTLDYGWEVIRGMIYKAMQLTRN